VKESIVHHLLAWQHCAREPFSFLWYWSVSDAGLANMSLRSVTSSVLLDISRSTKVDIKQYPYFQDSGSASFCQSFDSFHSKQVRSSFKFHSSYFDVHIHGYTTIGEIIMRKKSVQKSEEGSESEKKTVTVKKKNTVEILFVQQNSILMFIIIHY
jgi:hypothetical protein